MRRAEFQLTYLLMARALACFSFNANVSVAGVDHIIPHSRYLRAERGAVRGLLGALLVFVREIPKAEFDQVSKSIPNADHIMSALPGGGIDGQPLDDIGEYQASLASLRIDCAACLAVRAGRR